MIYIFNEIALFENGYGEWDDSGRFVTKTEVSLEAQRRGLSLQMVQIDNTGTLITMYWKKNPSVDHPSYRND